MLTMSRKIDKVFDLSLSEINCKKAEGKLNKLTQILLIKFLIALIRKYGSLAKKDIRGLSLNCEMKEQTWIVKSKKNNEKVTNKRQISTKMRFFNDEKLKNIQI